MKAHYEGIGVPQIDVESSEVKGYVIISFDGETFPLHMSDLKALSEIFQKFIEAHEET